MKRIPANKGVGAIVVTVCLIMIGYCIYRDICFEKDYDYTDLRNRVVGARMIMDGKSPYFYKWSPADGIRYYDPLNFDSLKVSNVTATPFFHRLLFPLANLPQWKIIWWWLVIEYLMFFSIVAMALAIARTKTQKWVTLLFASLFLFTEAWKQHIINGQLYLCIPFLGMVFYFMLEKGKKNILPASVAGLAATALVFIRPNALFYFVPFVFIVKNYRLPWLLAFFMPALILSAWTLTSGQERFLWQDFQEAVGEQLKIHQDQHPATRQNEKDPKYAEWEGITRGSPDQQIAKYQSGGADKKIYSENGNFFVLVKDIFHKRLSSSTLLVLSLLIIMVLSTLYYIRNRGPGDFDLAKTALLGYALYMVSDLFSPFYRHQYYTVQILFPLLLMAGRYRPAVKWMYALLLTGILLNISRIPFIRMEHTIGEYLIIAIIILFSFVSEPEKAKESKNCE